MYAPLLEVVVVSRVGEEYECTRVDLRHSTTQPLIIDRRIDCPSSIEIVIKSR